MSGEPLISILIPVYNAAKTLPETLASIQTRYPYEVILVDDCSTDKDTHRLLKDLEQEHAVFYQKENQGPGAAVNIAAKYARGKYIMQLDSDDLLTTEALDSLAECLENHPDIDVVWGDLVTFGSVESKKAMAPVLDPWYVTYLNNMPCCCLMRKVAWRKAGGWVVGRPGYHDWGMWIAMALSGARGQKLDLVMLKYRISENSLFHSTRKKYTLRHDHTLGSFARLGRWHAYHWFKSKAPWRLKFILPIYLKLPINPYKRSRQAKAWAAKYWFDDRELYEARLLEKSANLD